MTETKYKKDTYLRGGVLKYTPYFLLCIVTYWTVDVWLKYVCLGSRYVVVLLLHGSRARGSDAWDLGRASLERDLRL